MEHRPLTEATMRLIETNSEEESELIAKYWFFGIIIKVYSCGKIEYILEEDECNEQPQQDRLAALASSMGEGSAGKAAHAGSVGQAYTQNLWTGTTGMSGVNFKA